MTRATSTRGDAQFSTQTWTCFFLFVPQRENDAVINKIDGIGVQRPEWEVNARSRRKNDYLQKGSAEWVVPERQADECLAPECEVEDGLTMMRTTTSGNEKDGNCCCYSNWSSRIVSGCSLVFDGRSTDWTTLTVDGRIRSSEIDDVEMIDRQVESTVTLAMACVQVRSNWLMLFGYADVGDVCQLMCKHPSSS